MRRILCAMSLCTVLSAGTLVNGGDWWIGVRGGPSVPRLSSGGNEITRDYSSIAAPTFGAVVRHDFTDRFSLAVEIDYSGQGGERDGVQPITIPAEGLPPLPPGQYLYADFTNRSELNYLEIPALGTYLWRLSRQWSLRVKGGPYVGYLLNARQKTSGESQLYVDSDRTPLTIGGYELPPISFDADLDILNDLHRWNVGIMGGAGAAYVITPRHEVFFDVRGEYGFRTLQRDTELNGSSHTGAVAFLFGYMYNLSR